MSTERIEDFLSDSPRPPGFRARPVYGIRLFGKPVTRLAVKERDQWIWLDVERVVRIQADDDYVVIHGDGHRYMVYIRLSELHDELGDAHFLRVHRSHLANVGHVVRWRSYRGKRLELFLSDGSSVVTSRRLRSSVRPRLPEELRELGPFPPVPFTEV